MLRPPERMQATQVPPLFAKCSTKHVKLAHNILWFHFVKRLIPKAELNVRHTIVTAASPRG